MPRATRIGRHHPPDAAAAPPAARRGDRPRHLGEAREPQPDERLQGARRAQPRALAHARRARARHRHRQHRQSRPVDRAGVAAERRARAPCSCPRATTPRRTPRCAPLAPWSRKAAAISTRRASAASSAAAATGARYVHSANEPLLIAGVGDLRARDLRSAARGRVDSRADRRRQRRLRQLHRSGPPRARRPASSACRRGTPTH